MKTFLKTFIYLLVAGIVFLCLILNVRAQELTQDDAKAVELLKAKTDLILNSAEYLDENKIEQIKYSFIDKEVENAQNIIFDNNGDTFSNKEIIGNQYKVYALPTFYKNKDNIVFNIENSTVTKKIWQESNLQTTAEKIFSILKTPYVFANSYLPYSDVRFNCYAPTASGWQNAWNCSVTIDMSISEQGTIGVWYRTGINNYFYRYFGNFNTTGITNIATATLYIYSTENSVTGDYKYGVSTTSATDTIVVGDARNFGDTLISNAIDVDDMTDNSFIPFILTGLGTSSISSTGMTKLAVRDYLSDISYVEKTGDDRIFVRTSYYVGTNYDPYLLIATSTSSGGGTTTPPVASTTVLTCTPDTNLDIGVITSCAFATSGVTYTNYNLPILLYLYIVSLFLACYATFFMFKK